MVMNLDVNGNTKPINHGNYYDR